MASALWIVAALCAIPEVRPSPLPPKRSLIPAAIAHYNKESNSQFLFMLLSDRTESEGTNEARFTIKETECPKTDGTDRKACAYKAGGLEKNCSAEVKENRFTVVCTSREQISDGSKRAEGSKPSAGGRDAYSRERTVIIKENYQPASPVSDQTERKISDHEGDHKDNQDDHEGDQHDDDNHKGDHQDDHEGDQHNEDDHQGDHEGDQHDERVHKGDHMDNHQDDHEGDHQDDHEGDQHDEGTLADIVVQFSNDPPRDGGPPSSQEQKRKPLSGLFLGRILCLECIFHEIPRK